VVTKKDHSTKVLSYIKIIESEEPLHLCISSKFQDRYKFACNLVQELVASVYEEYKKYCAKINRIPVTCLAIRKEEGISSKKKNEFEI
jgi:hypothetical protein